MDPVEAALADALGKAASAGRFDVVSKLAAELEARRVAREKAAGGESADVLDLDTERKKRGQ